MVLVRPSFLRIWAPALRDALCPAPRVSAEEPVESIPVEWGAPAGFDRVAQVGHKPGDSALAVAPADDLGSRAGAVAPDEPE